MWRSRDELYLLLETAVQQFFLRGYGRTAPESSVMTVTGNRGVLSDASFSEYFYCLKRVSSKGGGGGGGGKRELQTRGRVLSLLCLVSE